MESARGDEENVIGFNHSVLRLHIGSLHDRQQIALHALARHVRSASGGTTLARNLIDLVEEDDAHRLHALERVGGNVLLVDQLLQLLNEENAARLRDLHAAFLLALGQHVLEHLGKIVDSLRCTLRHHHVEHHWRLLGDFDLDLAFVELAVDEQRFQFLARPLVAHLRCIGLARGGAARRDHEQVRATAGGGGSVRRLLDVRRHRQEQVEQSLFHFLLGDLLHL